LEYTENCINTIKGNASKSNKNPDNFRTIMLTYPNVKDGQSSRNDKNRFPLSGTIDEIGSDIQRVKGMGVDHVIFGYSFLPIGADISNMISITKSLSEFYR
jgi:hypothetical protein